jgi:type II secretory pathway pseudopilin PulG
VRIRPAQNAAREDGFVLIEILVSAMVLTIASAGVIMLLQTTTKTQAEQRHNTEAYALAQEDQARLASMRLASLNRLDQTRTVTLNKTQFQVRSRGVFINDNTSTPSCGEGTSTADYVEITSSVSWYGMDPGEKAKIVSVLSPSNGSLDPNHGTIAFSVKTQLQEPVPNVYVSGGSGAFAGYTDAAGCAVFADLPTGNYTATVSGSGTGMVAKSGEESEKKTISVVGGDTKTENFEFAPPGEIPVQFTYRVGTSGSLPPAKSPAIVAFNSGMSGGTAKTIWSATGEPALSIDAKSLFPFSSSYYLYAGSCAANNPEPEKNPAYAAATANVIAPAGGTAALAKLQLPVLDLLVTRDGSAFAGAMVTVTMADSSCKTPQGAPVRRTYTTNSQGRIANAGGEPATLPWGRYDLCASGSVSGTTRRDRDSDIDVKSLTGPTSHTINLTSGDSSGSCP